MLEQVGSCPQTQPARGGARKAACTCFLSAVRVGGSTSVPPCGLTTMEPGDKTDHVSHTGAGRHLQQAGFFFTHSNCFWSARRCSHRTRPHTCSHSQMKTPDKRSRWGEPPGGIIAVRVTVSFLSLLLAFLSSIVAPHSKHHIAGRQKVMYRPLRSSGVDQSCETTFILCILSMRKPHSPDLQNERTRILGVRSCLTASAWSPTINECSYCTQRHPVAPRSP